ncbi:MAG: c-type cytochrome [Flavobacteriales bacterium]|nr:c-type cytochrome [Flavobacteriales bacterium]
MGKRTKSKKQLITRLVLAIVVSCSATVGAIAQDGEQLFTKNCSACHKMGTRLVGPDLTGVTERRSEDWVKSFITNSQAMVAAGDADAVAIFEEYKIPMTSFPLSDAELTALVGYLGSFGAAAAPADGAVAAVVEEAPIAYTEEDFANGKAYFQGGLRLAGGGPSCISCHNVTGEGVIPGGRMAKDLTYAFGRMGGHAGVAGILGAPPFPAMTNAYNGTAALTEGEIHAIAAFLKQSNDGEAVAVDNTKYFDLSDGGQTLMLMYGFGGLILIFIVIGITWKGRLRKSAKDDINNRQLRSI